MLFIVRFTTLNENTPKSLKRPSPYAVFYYQFLTAEISITINHINYIIP